MENAQQVLHPSFGMALNRQKHEGVVHMFFRIFVKIKLSTGYANGESFLKKIIEPYRSNKSALVRALSGPR